MTDDNTYPYDENLEPPAPAFRISVRSEFTHREESEIFALIDSGADHSTIPKSLAMTLQLIPHDFRECYDFEGKYHGVVPVYYVTLVFGSFSFNVESSEVDANELLIGRDVLNQIRLLLDGKNLNFTISQ
jgi:hypothetical protein